MFGGLKYFTLGLLIVVFYSCDLSYQNDLLQEGDILFQDLDCGPLCESIESVTLGINNRSFSHCGMVINQNDSLFVIEAISDGVVLTPLQTFLARSNDTVEVNNVLVGRVIDPTLISDAKNFTMGLIGSTYDEVFTLNDDKYYCSELLYEGFKHANNNSSFFKLNVMTFKDPSTGRTFPSWIAYYEDLDQPIPEGKMGINPGAISRSKKIKIVEIDWLRYI